MPSSLSEASDISVYDSGLVFRKDPKAAESPQKNSETGALAAITAQFLRSPGTEHLEGGHLQAAMPPSGPGEWQPGSCPLQYAPRTPGLSLQIAQLRAARRKWTPFSGLRPPTWLLRKVDVAGCLYLCEVVQVVYKSSWEEGQCSSEAEAWEKSSHLPTGSASFPMPQAACWPLDGKRTVEGKLSPLRPGSWGTFFLQAEELVGEWVWG